MKIDLRDPAIRQHLQKFIAGGGLNTLSPYELNQLHADLEAYDRAMRTELAQKSLIEFCMWMNPEYKPGKIHHMIAEKLEAVCRGELLRLAVSMPPRHGKSMLCSEFFPAWYLGQHPGHKLMAASNTTDLAENFGRKVRNHIAAPEYQRLFPATQISRDSSSAGRWATTKQGEGFYAGVGTALAGRGADLFVGDDPFSENDDLTGTGNIYNKVYDWYLSGPRQRLMPGGRIVLIHCIAKGQRVATPRKGWVPIEALQPGDQIWAWDTKQTPVRATVSDARCSGVDATFLVKTARGDVHANARHPFLVVVGGPPDKKTDPDWWKKRNGWSLEWRSVRDINVGDFVVQLKNLPSDEGVRCARNWNGNKVLRSDWWWLLGFMFGDGWARQRVRTRTDGSSYTAGYTCVAKGVCEELNARVLVLFKKFFGVDLALTSGGYYRTDDASTAAAFIDFGLIGKAEEKRVPDVVFTLRGPEKRAFLAGVADADGHDLPPLGEGKQRRKFEHKRVGMSNVPFVEDLRLLALTCGVSPSRVFVHTRTAQPPNSKAPIQSTIARLDLRFKQSLLENRSLFKNQGLLGRYFRFTQVDAIETAGNAEVYDITVPGVENFIVEGFVSHNTRWSKQDLIGRVIEDGALDENADQFEYLELPAILDSGNSIWPEMWPAEQLLKVKATLHTRGKGYMWDAQYQQRPTGAGQTYVTREHFNVWTKSKPPPCDYLILSLDAAVEATKRSDYNVFLTLGIFTDENVVDAETGEPKPQVIVLDMVRERMEFPQLKQTAREILKSYAPDVFLIEKKANGAPLIHELRQSGLGVQPFEPGTQDKSVRFSSVVDIITSGLVWVPEFPWVETLLDEVCGFPNEPNDDIVDALVQALIYIRRGGYIGLASDAADEEDNLWFKKQQRVGYGAR